MSEGAIAQGPAEADLAQTRVAGWLTDQGLAEGDRVAVIAPSSLDYLNVALGALRTGIIPVLLNTSLLENERGYILNDAQPALVMGEAEVEQAAIHHRQRAVARWPLGRPMAYTSGTTGRPKGVYSGVLKAAEAEALWTEEIDLWGFTDTDVYLQIGPLYHSAPLRFAACAQLAGGSVVVPGPFEAGRTLEAIVDHSPTVTFAAPIHLKRLFGEDSAHNWQRMRLVAHAGAACPTEVSGEARQRFGEDAVWEFYGSTEGQFTVCSPEDRRAAPGSVGRARPNRRLSLDDDARIWCATPPYAAFTYWNDPGRTAQAWRTGEDGTAEFTVGDLGRLVDGHLYLDGRRDDLIISGGVNVYPAEVERALAEMDEVDDVAVFGVDDPEWGQAVHAVVVPSRNETNLSQHALRETVLDHARATLAPYKRPKQVLVRDSIPVNSTGKVRRSTLETDLGVTQPQR